MKKRTCECGGHIVKYKKGIGVYSCQRCGLIYMTQAEKDKRAEYGLSVPQTETIK